MLRRSVAALPIVVFALLLQNNSVTTAQEITLVINRTLNTAKLREYLMKGYNPSAVPLDNDGRGINVTVYMWPYDILDVAAGAVKISGWFDMRWKDPYLQWDPNQFGGINEMFIARNQIWLPEIDIFYSKDGTGVADRCKDCPVRVTNEGQVLRGYYFSYSFPCHMNVKYFPFDRHNCTLELANWHLDQRTMDLAQPRLATVVSALLSDRRAAKRYAFDHDDWSRDDYSLSSSLYPNRRMAVSDDDLCIGDVVGLYSEHARGYVFSFQSPNAHNEVAIGRCQTPYTPNIDCPHSIQFQIHAQNRYQAYKRLQIISERLAVDPSNAHLKAQVAQAKKFADTETADNEVEQCRQRGKPVYYGQIIQLRHAFTGKFIHVNTSQTSWCESSNLLVELLHKNSSRAQFKVLPRYKVKSEGDVVQIGDSIVLESVKSHGQYLHCSIVSYNETFVYHDCHELNLSVIQSGFSVHRSRNATDRHQNDTIMGCSIVQLFHKEMEGYVAAEGVFGDRMLENVHMRVRPITTANHKSLLPPTSAITCWSIEKETEVMTSTPIRWEENIRLQHLTTRRYMMVTADLKVGLSDSRDDPHTVFRFFPVSRLRSQTVRQKSFLRIQHVLTGAWIRGNRDEPYTRIEAPKKDEQTHFESVQWSRSTLRQLSGCAQMMYDDAFTIMLLDKSTLVNMVYIAGMVPFLQQLAREFKCNDECPPRRTHRTMSALLELKEFMLEFGVPIKSRQKLLRNFKIVDILVNLLKSGQNTRPTAFVQKVHAECYDILQVYLQGLSPKNELYLAKHIEFFQHQLLQGGDVGLSATYMLMELLKDNRCIIDHISHAHIDFFIELIAKKKNYRYLELLSVLCIAKGGTLPDNQTYIAKKWLDENLRRNLNVVDWLAMGEDIGRDRGELYISHNLKSSWQPLAHFIAQVALLRSYIW
uniref:Uncharacterized protein n=1 Tax=Plectus sambesii TaxID=2011161 RepID=A0A914XA54_9BILA